MNSLKTTLGGGVMFLLPLGAIGLLLGEAYDLALVVAEPLSDVLPVEDIGGLALANILAALLLLLICYWAGRLSGTAWASRLSERLDQAVGQWIPAYMFAKTVIKGAVGASEMHRELTPVVYTVFNASRIAFEVERLPDGRIVIFLPGAPNPTSGSVVVVEADTVAPLDGSGLAALDSLQRLGKGSSWLIGPKAG